MSGRRWDQLTDEEIDALDGAGEFPAVTDDDLRRAVAVSGAGRVKVPISIRVDEEALEFFRAQGPGYQTRINDVLLRYARGELAPAPPAAPARSPAPRRMRVTVRRGTVTSRTGALELPARPRGR